MDMTVIFFSNLDKLQKAKRFSYIFSGMCLFFPSLRLDGFLQDEPVSQRSWVRLPFKTEISRAFSFSQPPKIRT